MDGRRAGPTLGRGRKWGGVFVVRGAHRRQLKKFSVCVSPSPSPHPLFPVKGAESIRLQLRMQNRRAEGLGGATRALRRFPLSNSRAYAASLRNHRATPHEGWGRMSIMIPCIADDPHSPCRMGLILDKPLHEPAESLRAYLWLQGTAICRHRPLMPHVQIQHNRCLVLWQLAAVAARQLGWV